VLETETKGGKNLRILVVSVIIVLIDQFTKFYVKGFYIPVFGIRNPGLGYGENHNIIDSYLRFTFVENPGMAFGIDIGISSKLFLSLFSIAASIGILIYLYKNRNEGFMLRFSLALILGGAIGNLIDRVFYGVLYGYAPLFQGKVVDFIDVDFFDVNLFGTIYDRWPIFNVADMAVSIGVILLIFFSRKNNEKEDILNPDNAASDYNLSNQIEEERKISETEDSDTGNKEN
jgi:signal peptidase II